MNEPTLTNRVELLVLGHRDLIRVDGSRADGLLSQPKRFALFAYLACTGSRPIPRDELIAVFWPEAAEQNARNALSQSISVIRRQVGPKAIVASPREVGIDAAIVSCDVGRFDDAISRRDDDVALDLYRGDFLQGFQLPGAREFEDWLDRARARLRQSALTCARRLIGRETEAKNPTAALAIARRATAIDPYDEGMTKAAMLAQAELGNVADAVRGYAAYAQTLASDLDLEPSPELRALNESLRARLRESVSVVSDPVTPSIEAAAVNRVAIPYTPTRTARRIRYGVGAALVFLSTIALTVERYPRGQTAAHGSRLTILLDDSVRLRSELPGNTIALSPDGSRVAYVGGPNQRIYTRAIGELTPHGLAGTEGGKGPQFSPDGQSIAFHSHSTLKRVSLGGGMAVQMLDSVGRFSWGDGDIVLFDRPYGTGMEPSLYMAHLKWGTVERLTSIDTTKGDGLHTWPFVLPGGKSALFEIHSRGSDASELAAIRFDDRRVRRLGIFGHNPRFVDSFLLFSNDDGGVEAVSFDLSTLTARGSPVRVLDGVTTKSGGATEFAVAKNGTLLYLSPSRTRRLVVVDRAGRITPLPFRTDAYTSPRVSADGKRLAVAIAHGGMRDIWVGELGKHGLTQFTHDGSSDDPEWTSDGRLAWRRTEKTLSEFWWQTKAGPQRMTGPQKTVVVSPTLSFAIAAGTWKNGVPHQHSILTRIALDSAGRPTASEEIGFGARPKISADGNWLAFVAPEPTVRDVCILRLSPPFDVHRVSTGGADDPVWGRRGGRGQELIYRARGRFIAASLDFGRTVTVTRTDTLFEDVYWSRPAPGIIDYDVTPDGKEFVLLKSTNADAEPTIVFNWADEVRVRLK